ncbi:RICIN domain-containing protein [Flavitalea sp.]|nr:RICIN domain-containing protein [Flavitalea sp.]
MKKNILLFTKDINAAREELDNLGAQITQQFTDQVFVANLPDEVKETKLKASSTKQPNDLDEISKIAAEAWKNLQKKATDRSADSEEGIKWDTPGFEPPNKGHDDLESQAPEATDRSTGTPTSLHMNGSIAVGIIIVGGTGAGLGFSNADNIKVIQEVQEGLGFLANAEPRAKITFVYDIRIITVSAAPGSTGSYESAEAPWRNAALQAMGYPPVRQSSIDYVNDLRAIRNTAWAYVGYFTKYPLHHFAYAVTEKTVMHFDNDGWGTDQINKVFAHESCHIFGAADEYGSCTCGGSHGHLGVPNNNCTNCVGAKVPCLMDTNTLTLCAWSKKQIGWDESLFPQGILPLVEGNFTIQQKSNNRFVDAHEIGDHIVVTRPAQNNPTQVWHLKPVGTIYEIQQKSNNRFLDAHELNGHIAVTRPAQHNDTQRWVAIPVSGVASTYTIQQLSNLRFLDAHEEAANDFKAVTRPVQNNSSQQWKLTTDGNGFRIQQRVNNRFLDAHEIEGQDFAAVTRPSQANDSQRWALTAIGGVYTIQQTSNGRFLDAHDQAANDFKAVTRPAQNDSSQKWIILSKGGNTYSLQRLNTRRYLDAHEVEAQDFTVVTRPEQNNDTQRWIIKQA